MKVLRLRVVPLLLALATGCRDSPGAFDPTPELNCRAPFPELAGAGPAQDQGASGLEQALSRGGWPAAPSEEVSPDVPMAGRLVGQAPETTAGAWRWLVGRDLTFGIHTPRGGGAPDAFFYVQAFSSRTELRASEELMQFELTVDPALLGEQLTWPTDSVAWAETVARNIRERKLLRRLARMAATRTGGRGFGYASSPRTFTGWRWMGRNRQGVYFRLARTTGEWSGQKPLGPELQAVLPLLVQRFPHTNWLTGAGAAEPWSGAGTGRAPVPAYMVLGTAAAEDTGIYLAALCARTPMCGPAGDLASLLTSLRPAVTGEIDRLLSRQETGSIESLAADFGITLRDSVEPEKSPGLPAPAP